MLKKLLLFITLIGTGCLNAQTFYWVGGSGYWNDVTHWSHMSGGSPANAIPSANSNVIFDNASSVKSFTIHTLNSFEFKSITSQNTQFNIDVIGSPNVDLTINGDVNLNEYFYFKLNGKINLNPRSDVKYQFSHNEFSNDIFLNAHAQVELGVLSTTKSLSLTGNFLLKNSIVFANDLFITNAQIDLDHNTIQISNTIALNSANFTTKTNQKSTIICKKSDLSSSTLNIFARASGLKVVKISPQACTVTLTSFSDPTCAGLCNGTAVFNLSGCTNSPYIIQWINTDLSAPCQTLPPAEAAYASATYSVNTLCGCGTKYTVLFENSLGEQDAIQVQIVNPSATLLTFSQTRPTCNGFCNGQIRVNVLDGVTPLSINWNPPVLTHTNIVTKDTLKNACAGTYTLTVTNANGCLNTFNTSLLEPALLLANGSSSSITCNGFCTGSATVAPTGGTTPYTYSWNPATSNTTTISNLCAGVVSATVTDTRSCTATYTSSITQPPAITLTVTKTNLICGSLCDGTATITPTGGSGPYTSTWTPMGSGFASTGLCVGPYTVTVMDNLNCVKVITFTLTAPATLTATPTQTNLVCNSGCIGAINLNPSGGTGVYTYAWSPAAPSSSLITNLCAGPYSYTVTDVVNCTYINTVTLTEPPAITLTVNNTNVTCFGACNGTATGNISGGTGPYTFSWSPGAPIPPGQGTATITSLCPGTYTLRATDANGCFRTGSVTVIQPTAITPNTSSVSPTCNGICNGSINSVPSGGTAPYTFTLQPSVGPPTIGAPPFTGLCAGLYTLTIADALGCIATRTMNLTQPNPITLSLSATPINCFNQCNSTISALIGGGTATFTVDWGGGGSGLSINNQCAGVHTATVTDSKGCQATASINITSPPDMTVTVTAVNPNCNAQCTGIATATISGGTPNYTVNWSNGPIGNVNPNLCIGNYTATVTDSKGCVKTQTIDIITPPALTLTTTNGTVSCAGTCDGTVSVTPAGGTSPYFYSWNSSPVQTNSVAVGLCVGNYIASVTDSKGCIASATANVSQPAVLTTSISNVQPSCNICIGAATAEGVGGTSPYTYSWSPGGQTGPTAASLCVGTQTVIVTDSRGCTSSQTVQIAQTINIAITANSNTLTCNGNCTGIATANASGGTGPGTYSFTWTPAPIQTTQTATGLCAGTHTVIVKDAIGCSNTNTVTFTNPPAITLTVNQTNINCNSLCNGTASATATGGTGSLTYFWQHNGATTPSVNGLCAGDYTVTATDASNCFQTQIITITQTSALTATFTNVNPTGCNATDGSISFVPGGGTAPYSFTWTPGGSFNPLINLGDGTYILNLTDVNGCALSFTTTLSDPLGPTVTVTSNSITCFGSCVGSASLAVTASTPTFSVSWSAPIPAINTTTVAGSLCAGNYQATVTDANGCATSQTLSIAQLTQISSTGINNNVTCNALCSASINITPLGGTGPGTYSYSWSPAGGTVEDPTNLCAGNYSVNITDANSCSVTNTFVVSQPAALTLNFNKKDVLCNGGCTGAVRAVVGGGISPYTYTWTPAGSFVGSNLDTIVNLCSGIYTVIARDVNGCTITGTVSIGEPTVLTSSITVTNVKCNGQCNGIAVINPTGGTTPYAFSYNTTPPIFTQTVTGLCVGTYTGIVTDTNGCSSSNGFIITEPLPIVITTTVSNPKCNSVCNGSIATTVTGGNSATYQYNWIPGGGTVANPTGLCAGNYTVTVTDDSLCTNQGLVTLVEPASLIANTSFTNPTCNAGCNGIVSANPIGGTGPFSYSWTNPLNTNQTVPNLCAGNYTVIVSDFNSCQDTQMVTLTSPVAISVNPGLSPATCGVSNGSINAPAAGGTPNYTYNWLNPILAGQVTNSLVINIPAGIYTVVVTDAAACSSTIIIPLSDADGPIGATITSTNVACNGQFNGAAAISNPVGGTPSYTISWINPVSTNSLITGLGVGTYTAEIEDANNCLFFPTVVITEPQLIDDNENITSALCFGNCSGSIALNPTGGNGGYTYSWTPAAITPTITSLCPGIYSVTITDVLGCTLTAGYNLPNMTTITSNTVATNNICFNNCNGTLLATNVAGGLPPYSFNWTDPLGQSTPLASSLCNDNYSVTITDANGCFNVFPASITSPTQVTFTPTITQPGCGLCDGVAVVNPVGGTPNYAYVWSANNQTTNTATNLCAGVYVVQITDGNGCVSNSNVVINSSSTFTGEAVTFKDVSCSSVCDGTVTVTAIGGTNPIVYNWVHNSSSSQTLVGLCEGTYFCNMTDSNGCTRTASVVIGATTTLTLTPQISQSDCSVNTGSINVNVIGGAGTYTYTWFPAAANSPSLTNLAPGNYTLTVSDGSSCSQTQVYSINSVNGPILSFVKNDITCSGVCDGNIALTISGGTPGYTTLWSNGAPTPSINALCPGPYSVTVTDGAGCIAVQNFSVSTVASPIVFSAPDIDNPLCNNNCNGAITSIPSGGVLPYTYSWVVSTSTTSVANNLCSGNYSVTVTDANGCAALETHTLTGPSTISVTAVLTDVRCNGNADGAIDLTVLGGTPGYTYSWTPGGFLTQDLANLVANTYSVVITDNNGCVVDSSFVITEPTAIDDNEIISSSVCFGNCNGSIELNPTGGTGGYTYSWTPSASTGTLTGLCPGPQTATITDSQLCTFIATYNIPSLITITSSTLGTDNICFDDCNGVLTATNIAGGVGPYALQWNDAIGQIGNTAINLCTGNYSVTITDLSSGCYNMIPANVNSTSQVTFTPTITAPSCNLCNGSAIVNPVGGTLAYNFLWSNNQTGNTATNLCSGVYAVQITDGNGCINTTSVVINSSSGITGETIIFTDATCSGGCDGTANVTAIGGVLPISYNWVHNNSSSQSLAGLCSGTYFCNMTDSTGCIRTASVVIGSITTLTISSQVSQSSCSSNTGSITVNVTGGTGAYTYAWLPAGATATVTNLAPGSYTLTVSDGNCTKTQVYSINSINGPVLTATKKDASCSGICDGNIVLTISAGTPTYTTLWSNAATTTSISALCAGAYSVEVTDAAGCKAVKNFTLSPLSPIVFSAPDLNHLLCNNNCDGSITSIPTGGSLPYTFSWTPTAPSALSSDSLCAGNYSISIMDANGCLASETYTIISPAALTLTAVVTDGSCTSVADGAVNITVAGGIPGPGYTFSWTPGGNPEDLFNVLPGTYSLSITDNNGCKKDSTILINATVVADAIAGNDTAFCVNGSFFLDGSNSVGGVTYQWLELPLPIVLSNTTTATVNPAIGTNTYVLVATNGTCIDQDSIRVTVNALPVVDAGPFVSIPMLTTAVIGGSPTAPGGGTLNWTPILALDNPMGSNPTSATTVTTQYTVTLIDANGCLNSDTVTVFVYPEIKIPNGFSPNGDGKNDVWQIDLIYQFPDCEVEVYNRWGEQLFYSKGYTIPFNGQYKGKDLPVGTYYYIINLNHPTYPDAYTSPLTIFR